MTAPEYILAGCAALGVLANWGTNRFYYGKLTQTVTTTSDEVNRLRGKVENHGERLVAHDERLGPWKILRSTVMLRGDLIERLPQLACWRARRP
jgi:hypothetical protein